MLGLVLGHASRTWMGHIIMIMMSRFKAGDRVTCLTSISIGPGGLIRRTELMGTIIMDDVGRSFFVDDNHIIWNSDRLSGFEPAEQRTELQSMGHVGLTPHYPTDDTLG